MAADTRPYRDQIKDKDGNTAIIRDKFLTEQQTGQSLSQTDYFEICDLDGHIFKFPVNSFYQLIQQNLGSILASINNGANIGKFLTLNLTENVFGSSSVDNAKSSILGRTTGSVGSGNLLKIQKDTLVYVKGKTSSDNEYFVFIASTVPLKSGGSVVDDTFILCEVHNNITIAADWHGNIKLTSVSGNDINYTMCNIAK